MCRPERGKRTRYEPSYKVCADRVRSAAMSGRFQLRKKKTLLLCLTRITTNSSLEQLPRSSEGRVQMRRRVESLSALALEWADCLDSKKSHETGTILKLMLIVDRN